MRTRAAFSPASSASPSATNPHVSKLGQGSEARPSGVFRLRMGPLAATWPAPCPRSRVRRKDSKGLPGGGKYLVSLVHGRVLAPNYFDARLPPKLRQISFDSPAEWIRVSIEEDRLRPTLLDQVRQFLDGRSAANDQSPSHCTQASGQRRQAPTEEMLPIRARPTVPSLPGAQNEHRDNPSRTVNCSPKGRIVGNTKVAAKPNDRRLHR